MSAGALSEVGFQRYPLSRRTARKGPMASKIRQQCCVCVNASAHKQILHATCSKGRVEGARRRPAKLLMMGHVRTSVVKELPEEGLAQPPANVSTTC